MILNNYDLIKICARPHLGKHINCVAMDDENWLICGGGPRLTMVYFKPPSNIINL